MEQIRRNTGRSGGGKCGRTPGDCRNLDTQIFVIPTHKIKREKSDQADKYNDLFKIKKEAGYNWRNARNIGDSFENLQDPKARPKHKYQEEGDYDDDSSYKTCPKADLPDFKYLTQNQKPLKGKIRISQQRPFYDEKPFKPQNHNNKRKCSNFLTCTKISSSSTGDQIKSITTSDDIFIKKEKPEIVGIAIVQNNDNNASTPPNMKDSETKSAPRSRKPTNIKPDDEEEVELGVHNPPEGDDYHQTQRGGDKPREPGECYVDKIWNHPYTWKLIKAVVFFTVAMKIAKECNSMPIPVNKYAPGLIGSAFGPK